MEKEKKESLAPNEVLVNSLPEIAQDLDYLWDHFANTTIGFAGGGIGDEFGRGWANKVSELVEDCVIPTVSRDGWGELVTSLHDLSEDLKVHFSPLRLELPKISRRMSYFRMDRNAKYLIGTFERRGYLKRNDPFTAPEPQK